jgi:acyl-CoA thioesterase I
MQSSDRPCDIPIELIRFPRPLEHVARSLARCEPMKIVAVGSSSTKGEGASSPVASYPSRLEAELQLRFPTPPIVVVNKGVGGEEAAEEAARFDRDVIAERPTLVVWQVGTNAVWHDLDLDQVNAAIRHGLSRLRELDADTLLDATRKEKTERMVALIASDAGAAGINLFARFALMRHWNLDDGVPIEQMISNADGNELHQNDWSYGCLGRALAEAIAEAATRTS